MIFGLSLDKTRLGPLGAASLACAILLIGTNASPASAAPSTVAETSQVGMSTADEITPEMLEQAYSELLASDLPRVTNGEGEEATTTFELADGFELTFGTAPTTPTDDTITPYIGGGSDSRGLYVLLNQFDQGLVISGSGFALGAAICAIPAVGTAACVVVGAILTVATSILAANGTCKYNKRLKIYVTGGVRSGGCV